MNKKEELKKESEEEKAKAQNIQKFLMSVANNIKNAYQEREREYFDLQLTISDNAKYTNCITKNMMKLPMEAQIEILRTLAKTGEVSKKICERYDLDVEEW